MFAKRSLNAYASVDGASTTVYIAFHMNPVNDSSHKEWMSIWLALRWRYQKTSAVVGNLRVAGDVVIESWELELCKFKLSQNFADSHATTAERI